MNFPFTTDYAKSSRSICRGCSTPIMKNTLRIAIMLQSNSFDGIVPNWYHHPCFFVEHIPESSNDIENFDLLRWEDKQEIKDTIAAGESPYSNGNGEGLKKAIAASASKASIQDYTIEYTKFARTKCEKCKDKIMKDEIRVSKKSKKILWYHFKCFVECHESLGYLEGADQLTKYADLSSEDQEQVKNDLPGRDEVPMKKQRLSTDAGENLNMTKEENIDKDQTNILHTYRNQLKDLKKEQLVQLLRHNKHTPPTGIESLLDRTAEMLIYGSPSKCPTCHKGQLVYTNSQYKCNGFLGPWQKCNNIVKKPKFTPVVIPLELKLQHNFLNEYEYKKFKRQSLYDKSTVEKPTRTGPLRYKNFILTGFSTDEYNVLRLKIKCYGGRVVPEVRRSVFAIITTKEEVNNRTEIIAQSEVCNVYVVSKEFLDNLVETHPDNLDFPAKKYSLCEWGAELHNRVPEQFQKPDFARHYKSRSKGGLEHEEEGKRRMRVKNGVAIEPGSKLEEVAHVYQIGDVRYNAVLSKTDLQSNQNTYYKIQLLESDTSDEYWVYRGWGRIGTTIGDSKIDKFETLFAAQLKFKSVFLDKSGNAWENRFCFRKKRGRYMYVDVDYQAQKEEIADLSVRVADSSLAPSVAYLMAMIFNVQSMEKVMLEYELDMQKMPLGKLSRSQIKQAYNALNEISFMLKGGSKYERNIITHSNMFYSLMPHNAAMAAPPMLDNQEIIKKKSEMLASLMELETAYCMIQRGAAGENGNPLDAYYKQLNTTIEPVDELSDEYSMIQDYVTNTHGHTHDQYALKILDIFKVKRFGEDDRYKPYSKLHNRKLLWHGSRTTNYAGILSQGLRIAPPEAPATGYMFGKGVYFADMVSKSANYCCTTLAASEGLMLLCEVALGNMMKKTQADYVTKLPANTHSVKGVGRTEPDPQDLKVLPDGVEVPLGKGITDLDTYSPLLYNEYIVYDEAQVNVKYLLRLDFKYNL